MQNKGNTLVIGIVLLALILGGYFLFLDKEDVDLNKSDDGVAMEGKESEDKSGAVMEDGTKTEEASEVTEVMEKKEDTMSTSKGSYEAYSPDKLAMADTGDVVLFFHASWCPTCKAADSDINKNLSNIPNGVHILKTDYDSNTELKKKYGVTYQHTFVQVDSNGNLINKWSGSTNIAEIVANIK